MTGQQNFCPQCSSSRQDALRYCANCGFDYWMGADPDPSPKATTATTPAPSQPAADQAAAVPEKRSNRLGCVAIGIVVLLIIGFIASMGQDPEGSASATATPTDEPTVPPADAPESDAPTPSEAPPIPSVEP